MKMRSGMKDDAERRAPLAVACPRAKARGCREAGFPGAATAAQWGERNEQPRNPARAMLAPPFPSLRPSAWRVPGAWPSGRPGQRARSNKQEAGAAPPK